MAVRRFERNYTGKSTFECANCHKQTRETGSGESSVGMCAYCYESAGWENALQDGNCTQEEFDAAIEQLDVRYKRGKHTPPLSTPTEQDRVYAAQDQLGELRDQLDMAITFFSGRLGNGTAAELNKAAAACRAAAARLERHTQKLLNSK